MTLRLLGLGFGRTGTLSTKHALEMLGWGPCHHMQEIRDNPALLPDWTAAAQGKPTDWERVFRGWTSQIDWPGSRYWRQLLAFFPTAQVLLNIRDPDEWYESLRNTIIPSTAAGLKVDSHAHTRAMAEMVYATIHQQIFHDRIEDRDFAIQVYLDHVREVKEAVPSDQLLIFDVKDGWLPLCNFLGTEIPGQAFPHKNTRTEFIANRDFFKKLGKDQDVG